MNEGSARRGTKGCFISHLWAYGLFFFYVASLVAVGLLVHFLSDRPHSLKADVQQNETSLVGPSPPSQKPTNVRLPRAVLPRHYDIRLLPVLENENFTTIGQVEIDIEVMEETSKIVLHSADITVDESSITISKIGSNQKMTVHGVQMDKDLQFLIIKIHGDKLKKGSRYKLFMKFVGYLNDELRGFYRSSYIENGVTKYLATTQMEPVDARRAFPCFDEPNMKAEFTITLGRHQSMKALSNMPLVNSTPIEGFNGYYWDRFERSVPMSTYLVAMIVSEFSKVTSVHDNKWNFTVYARPSAVNQTIYASEIGPKILAFYEDYFGIEYPLPKQDMIAIPDFAAGAMENWGLITYRETALLFDEAVSSVSNKQRVAVVVAHELAHQWFGNLVTMDWWTDLWLNEGFASYIEFIGVNHVEPEFNMFQQIVVEDVQSVMEVDALETSHPISVVVRHPDEINEIFDRISYSKGCAIIRMLYYFIGDKSFKEGLHHYLTSRKYGNAVQDDLWQAFTDLAKKNNVSLPATVKAIMDTWTLKMGYPVITVTRDYNQKTAKVTQKRFLLREKSDSSTDSTVYLWWVPLTYTNDLFGTTETAWMADNQSEITLTNVGLNANNWVIFNLDEAGFYRVNYDSRNWDLIRRQLFDDHTAIPVINRAQIMDDSLALAQAGMLDYALVLNLTRYLYKEDDYLPLASSLDRLDYINDMLLRTSAFGLFRKHMKHIVFPAYDKLQFDAKAGKDIFTLYKQKSVAQWACSMGHKNCIDQSVRIYRNWMNDPENETIVPINLKLIIACTAIREGEEEEWNFAFQRYLKTNVASEKSVLLSAMSCTRQGWILARMLEGSLNSSSGIRKQDGSSVFSYVSSNPLGRYMAFDYIRNHWLEVKNYFVTLSGLSQVVESVTSSFNTELDLEGMKQFAMKHKEELGSGNRAIQQAIDRTQNNVKWMKENYHKVVDWLERTYQSI